MKDLVSNAIQVRFDGIEDLAFAPTHSRKGPVLRARFHPRDRRVHEIDTTRFQALCNFHGGCVGNRTQVNQNLALDELVNKPLLAQQHSFHDLAVRQTQKNDVDLRYVRQICCSSRSSSFKFRKRINSYISDEEFGPAL